MSAILLRHQHRCYEQTFGWYRALNTDQASSGVDDSLQRPEVDGGNAVENAVAVL